jgi:hypothetical protein
MNAESAESILHAITPGPTVDMYYPGESNMEKQAFPSTVENRFISDLPSLNFGATSTIIFNPMEGLGDIVLTATLPAPANTLYTDWALGKGWLSRMIDSIGIRVGGSSLYYFTGDQLEIATFKDCEASGKKNAVWELAGSEILTLGAFASEQARTASIYIKCPWNSISALQKPLPLPTDLLSQPLQYLIRMKRADEVFFPLAGALAANLPTGFQSASVQFKQVHLTDTGHQLARRVNMNEEALSFPLPYFQQTTFRTTVSATVGQDVQINLTGFRAGSVKSIDIWALQVADGAGVPVNVGNDHNWSQILDATLAVNGLRYYQTAQASSQLWALCDLKSPAYVDNTVLADAGGGAASAAPAAMPWVTVPFAQVSEVLANEHELATGLSIANSVVNLSLKLPATGRYVISCSYNYVSSLLFSKGTAEYVFA